MQAYELQLTNNGYVDAQGNPLASIEGLHNCCGASGDERFYAVPTTGYPDVPCAAWAEIPGVSVLVWCETAPTGGVPKTQEEALVLLKGAYGWPENTAYVDGLPVSQRTSIVYYQPPQG